MAYLFDITFLVSRLIRQSVVSETLEVLAEKGNLERMRALAFENLDRWRQQSKVEASGRVVELVSGDWGVVAQRMTRLHGQCFAVLNMANSIYPGGGYLVGCAAQEENMFRRTDCHFSLQESIVDPRTGKYRKAFSDLLNARDGRVFLDTEQPRICVRGPECPDSPTLGYEWLPDDEIFPFYELRAAAQDCRGEAAFNPDEARRRIAAQLDTLIKHKVRYTILSAFGCGAFLNPAVEVAGIYREAIEERQESFNKIVFAIHHAGYGPDNFTAFLNVFKASIHRRDA